MTKVIFSFSIILFSLLSGYAFNQAVKRGTIRIGAEVAERIRRWMQRIAMLAINPIAFCGAVWVLDLGERRFLALPFFGVAALALGLAVGLAGARLFRLAPLQAGVYAASSSFTNIGNIGGLVVYILLGEAAFALVPFYKLFEDLWNYGVLFPLARHYGYKVHTGVVQQENRRAYLSSLARIFLDPFLIVAISSIALGLTMNLAGFVRPSFYASLNSILIPLSSFLFLFAIGMNMRFKIAQENRRIAGVFILGKALIIPAAVTFLAYSIGFGGVAGGLGLRVVLVLAAMPTGFLSLVPPSLYGLDQEFAGSLWLASNGALIFIIPLLSLLLRI